MDETLEQALAKRFPVYKRNKDELTHETLFKWFGFECGPGWVPLLIEFAQSAESLDIFNVQIDQIKEKWDTLRIYYSAGGHDQEKLEDIALDIETRSASICEICGCQYDLNIGCCRNGNVDIKAINERMLLLIEDQPVH